MESSNDRFSFPDEEKKILAYWDSIKAFEKSLEISRDFPRYTFYDGPPFATGLPHYGHILAGTVKDIVTRHACQLGFHVERRFGWDCHGLPVEYEIDKTLGITGKEDVLRMGIPAYNQECRNIVLRYTSEWEVTVKRMGRWIDFKNDYKTMDPSFMESVWWVFGQLFEKGQIYRGYRVMHYSYACATPLSNFEANQNYKEVTDPSIVVSFPIIDNSSQEKAELLAWTTTPWTLPSNLALCVNANFDYVKVMEVVSGRIFILLEKAISMIWKDSSAVKILSTIKGAQLKGLHYEPLFPYYKSRSNQGAFCVLTDSYVSDEAGTGIVHQAPGFGEDDFRICMENDIVSCEDIPCPIDDNGKFTSEIVEYAGLLFKDADKSIIKQIDGQKRLLFKGQITHNYPMCWRSDTPLIYKAVPCWFVRVKEIVPQLLENNKKTYWVPEFVQEKRFHNWLENARDWAISRNRFWGTPIPLWTSDDFQEIVCISSIKQLEELSGVRGIKDLHRESIDHILIPSKQGKGMLRRVEEVLDCWFESGSMPYAQQHYPFENQQEFERSFPANFIAEGLDQTRGWFYVLMVLSTHLFDKPAFQNLIVNGLVLAADGKKMSKRLKNYPEPSSVIDRYGADALRLYLINSPVVKAEILKFKEDGVSAILKDVFLPWYNAFKFLTAQIESWEMQTKESFSFSLPESSAICNIMDRWILASCQNLIQFVQDEMAAYRLYTVVPRLLEFIEKLTNWYVRLNRRRLKGESGLNESLCSIQVLFEVVFSLSRVMAPFTPFLTEIIFQTLKKWISDSCVAQLKGSLLNYQPGNNKGDSQVKESSHFDQIMNSIHFLPYPSVKKEFCSHDIERAVDRMRTVIEMARRIRESKSVSLKTPLKEMSVLVPSKQYQEDLEGLRFYIVDEINIRSLYLTQDEDEFGTTYKALPNFKLLGQRIKGDLPKVQKALSQLHSSTLKDFLSSQSIEVAGIKLLPDEMEVFRSLDPKRAINCESAGNKEILISLNVTVDSELREEGLAREIINRVQRLRKKFNLKPSDSVNVHYEIVKESDNELRPVFVNQSELLTKSVKSEFVELAINTDCCLGSEIVEISESLVKLSLVTC